MLGNFPLQAEDALIPLAWLEKCQHSEKCGDGTKLRAGLDVAGPGEDETVLYVRDGPRIIFGKSWMQADPRGEVVAALKQYEGRIEVINVDSAGIGWNMYTHLNDLFPGIAHPINVGESSHDPEKYANLKAELYWGLRMRAQAGDLTGYLDEKLIGQLAGIRYKHNARGQIVIESKEDARKRGVKSPDRAEAVMLAFAQHELPYGLTTYMLEKQAELREKERSERMQETAERIASVTGGGAVTVENFRQMKVSSAGEIAKLDAVPADGKKPTAGCPICGAICISPVSSGGFRCGSCAHQWNTKVGQTLTPFTRGNLMKEGL